ncbi:MAG: TIGR00268 family protein, partial [Bacillota bacterium]
DRPGMKALEELSVRSPLRECGITKAEIRKLSKEAGLFTWDKPSYACLATRVPTGTAYTYEVLEKVERAEGALFELGFTDFRVRVFNGAARLQLPLDQFDKAMRLREDITRRLSAEFSAVLLDLVPRA